MAALLGYQYKISNFFIFVNPGLFYGKVLNSSNEGYPFENLPYRKNFDKEWDYGVMYGGGCGVVIGNGKLLVESRYRESINKFRIMALGEDADSIAITLGLKNKGWGLNLCYAVNLGNRRKRD